MQSIEAFFLFNFICLGLLAIENDPEPEQTPPKIEETTDSQSSTIFDRVVKTIYRGVIENPDFGQDIGD